MCTLAILPFDRGFLLAMNRDERVTRAAGEPPAWREHLGVRFLAPRDPEAGGTWIAASSEGRVICVMNGERAAPGWREPERVESRGHLAPGLIALPDGEAVEERLRERLARGELAVRPFALVRVESGPDAAEVLRLDFDGESIRASRARAPYFATSNALDPDGVARARRARFDRFLAGLRGESATASRRGALIELMRGHEPAEPGGGLYSFCMHGPEVRTMSLTLVEASGGHVTMEYRAGSPCSGAPPAP